MRREAEIREELRRVRRAAAMHGSRYERSERRIGELLRELEQAKKAKGIFFDERHSGGIEEGMRKNDVQS